MEQPHPYACKQRKIYQSLAKPFPVHRRIASMRLLVFFLLGACCGAASAACPAGMCGCCFCLSIGTFCDGLPEKDFSSRGLGEIEPLSFQYADHLTSLDLSANSPLTLNSGSFVGLTNLQTLVLNHNGFTSLPDGVFVPTGNLRELDLSTNQFSSLSPESFRGLVNLTTLYLESNPLSSITSEWLEELPSLTNVTFRTNSWDCSNENITVLYRLIQLGVVTDGNLVVCSNGTSVMDLGIEIEVFPSSTAVPSTSLQMTTPTSFEVTPTPSSIISTSRIETTSASYEATPTSLEATPTSLEATPTSLEATPTSLEATPTSLGATPTSLGATPTSLGATPTSLGATPTPTPFVLYCTAVTTLLSEGFFDWPETLAGIAETVQCPNGPAGGTATRDCMANGVWGAVNVGECEVGSETTQLLAGITEITEDNSVAVSEMLASLSPDEPLSVREVTQVVAIAEGVVDAGGSNVTVLNNTLLAISSVLESSGDTLLSDNSGTITARLRQLIDTILLDALNANQTHLVLSFSHLVVGGVYLPPTNESSILTVIHVYGGGHVEVGEGEEEGEEEVEIIIDSGDDNITVQVTVYDNPTLFNSTGCEGEGGVGGDVVTPVISVTDSEDIGGEEITITFNGVHVASGDTAVCVKWNSTLNCGQGGWQMAGCTLVYSQDNSYQCQCQDQGSFSILDVPGSGQAIVSSDSLHLAAKVFFYSCCGLTLPLYITIIFSVLLNRFLYILPTMQSLVAMAITQALSFVILAVSYKRTELQVVCYTMATLQHYLVLVSLAFLCVYPLMVCIRVFRRMWYEKEWLMAPFVIVCAVFPAVPVAVYGGIKYSNFPDEPDLCWLEEAVFPNYFTYVSAFVAVLTAIITLSCMILLRCSDYTIEPTLYPQLASILLNLILFYGTIVSQFLTADGFFDSDYLLMVTGSLALICGVYFFIVFGVAKSRIRSALMCREDPILKNKVAHYNRQRNSSGSRGDRPSTNGSRTSFHMKLRRQPMRLTDEMNINYVDAYLGNGTPLAMLNQVQEARPGKRVRKNKRDNTEGYRLSQASSAV